MRSSHEKFVSSFFLSTIRYDYQGFFAIHDDAPRRDETSSDSAFVTNEVLGKT